MVGNQDPMCVEDVKVVIDQLLQRMPEGERVSLLQSQLARCGVRGQSISHTNSRDQANKAKNQALNAGVLLEKRHVPGLPNVVLPTPSALRATPRATLARLSLRQTQSWRQTRKATRAAYAKR